MKAIVVTDQAAGTAGMKLVERPEPQGAALRQRPLKREAPGFRSAGQEVQNADDSWKAHGHAGLLR